MMSTFFHIQILVLFLFMFLDWRCSFTLKGCSSMAKVVTKTTLVKVSSMRWWKFSTCGKVGNMGIANFHNFIPKIEITMNFGSPNVVFSSSQCLESSNSGHSTITFSLTSFYFLAHYYKTCVIILLTSKSFLLCFHQKCSKTAISSTSTKF